VASLQEISMLTEESVAERITKEDITKNIAMEDIMTKDTIMADILIKGTRSGGTILENTLPEGTIMESAIIEDTMDIPFLTGATPVGYSDSLLVAFSNQWGHVLEWKLVCGP
jgi:hypothetical protein